MGRELVVDGLINARDLGGLPLRQGGTTPSGVFFRSAVVDRVTPDGWRRLHELGIRTVVDLRAPGEVGADVGERPAWLTTVTVDVDFPADREFWEYYEQTDLDGTALYFLPLLERSPERAVGALTALAGAPPGGVLFHCAAGRDRTGLIALMLLSIAGVEPEAIVDDYLESVRGHHARAAAAGTADFEDLIEQVLTGFGTTTEQAFRDALDGLLLEEVLQRGGFTPAALDALRTWRGHLPGDDGDDGLRIRTRQGREVGGER